MAVFRVERTRDYTVMCNHHLKDSNLSLKAKGLLSMMLSLPDEWNYTTRGLAAICKEGVDAIGKTLKELELAGYIIRRQLRGKDGRISDTEYTIFEKPRKPSPPDTTLPDTENPYLDNPDTGAPDTDNPAQLNTKKSNTQKSNTDLSSTHSFFLPAADGMTDGFEKKAEIREQIEYDILCQQYDRMQLDELVEIIGSFNRIARKYGIDFAPFKVKGEKRYMVFFKAPDADAMTAAFKEYTAKQVRKVERPSVLEKLQHFKSLIQAAVVDRTKRKELER